MKKKWASAKLIQNRKQHQRHGAITTTRYKGVLTFHLEKAKKRVIGQNTSDTFYTLLGKHIVGNNNRVVEHEAMRQGVRVQQERKGENQPALQHGVLEKARRLGLPIICCCLCVGGTAGLLLRE